MRMRILLTAAVVCGLFCLASVAHAQCSGGRCEARSARGGKGLPVVRRVNGERAGKVLKGVRRVLPPWRT